MRCQRGGVLLWAPMDAASPSEADAKELYERYGRAVYRRCQYFLRNHAEAQDAMHDVFVKVVENYETFKGEASPLTWMVRITTNHCLNLLRSKRAQWRDRYESTVRVGAGEKPNQYSRLERQELILALLRKMDAQSQEAAVFYFVDEMTQEDAAKAAQCSVPTLRKRLRRFIQLARKELRHIDADAVFGEAPV